jgi:hypothetical protein
MPLLRDWELNLDVDLVLRGQGADPAVIRERRPALAAAAEQALQEGHALLDPSVAYAVYPAEGLRHERLSLQDGRYLAGALIAQHLAAAEEVVILVCTIGEQLEQRVTAVMPSDPVRGLALDGFGSAAAEVLAAAACSRFEEQAASRGLQATIPLSPGMVGWPVAEGQERIFSLVDAQQAGVTLTDGGMMIPRKSVSLVLGLGKDVRAQGKACDFCTLRETCRYQEKNA